MYQKDQQKLVLDIYNLGYKDGRNQKDQDGNSHTKVENLSARLLELETLADKLAYQGNYLAISAAWKYDINKSDSYHVIGLGECIDINCQRCNQRYMLLRNALHKVSICSECERILSTKEGLQLSDK